jgi:hypothetical protein
MQQTDYIGYKNNVGMMATLATGGAAAPITIPIDVILAVAPIVLKWASGLTAHPAADARDFIKNAKPQLVTLNAKQRLLSVIAESQKINVKAVDVNAAEWLLWYKTTYAEDYKQLDNGTKLYWNRFLNTVKSSFNNPNNMNRNLDLAMFTQSELNYNASPLQNVTNLFSSGTGKTNWVLYGAIGIGAILLIKYIRK